MTPSTDSPSPAPAVAPAAAPAPSVSGARKAAIFVMGIGGSLGAELLRQLEPDEIRRISAEISVLHAVAPENMVSVFREFEALSGSSKFFAKGGADCARRLVEQALGAESAQKLLDGPPKEEKRVEELEILQQTGPQQLAVLLREENPQTIALVLVQPAGGTGRSVDWCCCLWNCSRRWRCGWHRSTASRRKSSAALPR